jgi:serine/threonine protein kinase
LGVVDHLEKLHKSGYVHGDIRASNIIFIEEDVQKKIKPNGFLIDFDLSGKEGEEATRYPEGYNVRPYDGYRMVNEGDKITKRDDWFALRHVLFALHEIVPPPVEGARSKDARLEVLELKVRLSEYRSLFASYEPPTSRDIRNLKKVLGSVNTWNIQLFVGFQSHLLSLQLYGDNIVQPGRHATGSTLDREYELVRCQNTRDGADVSNSARNKPAKHSRNTSAAKNQDAHKRHKCSNRRA